MWVQDVEEMCVHGMFRVERHLDHVGQWFYVEESRTRLHRLNPTNSVSSLDCLCYSLKCVSLVVTVFFNERLDLYRFVFLFGTCFSGSIRLSLVTLLHAALDSGSRFGVGLLFFIENVARTATLSCLPNSLPHQPNRPVDLCSEIQKMNSVITLLFHPAPNVSY